MRTPFAGPILINMNTIRKILNRKYRRTSQRWGGRYIPRRFRRYWADAQDFLRY